MRSRLKKLSKLSDGISKKIMPDRSIQREVDYSNSIPVCREVYTGQTIEINPVGTTRIGLFAQSGNGKTAGLKAIMSRFFDSGHRVFHASDRKNDFLDIDYKTGASKQLIKEMSFQGYRSLLPGEKRKSIPLEAYSPYLLKEKYGEFEDRSAPTKLNFFTIDFSDVNKEDIKLFLNPSSDNQERVIDNLLEKVEWKNASLSQLMELTDEIENNQTRKSIQNRIEALQNKDIISKRRSKNLFSNFNEKVVVLSVKNYRRAIGANMAGIDKLRFYIANALSKLVDEIKKDMADTKTLVIFDDPQDFIKAGSGDNMVSNKVQDLIDVGARKANIPLVISTQRPSQIPNSNSNDPYNFLGELDKIFLGPNLDEDEWKPVLRSTNLYNRYYLQRWRNKFKMMGQYEFLYIDTENHKDIEDCPIVRFLSPLCAHTG